MMSNWILRTDRNKRHRDTASTTWPGQVCHTYLESSVRGGIWYFALRSAEKDSRQHRNTWLLTSHQAINPRTSHLGKLCLLYVVNSQLHNQCSLQRNVEYTRCSSCKIFKKHESAPCQAGTIKDSNQCKDQPQKEKSLSMHGITFLSPSTLQFSPIIPSVHPRRYAQCVFVNAVPI